MSAATLPHDPKWKRAHTVFSPSELSADFALIGVPAHKGSISPTNADQTPNAIRSISPLFNVFNFSKY